MTDGVCGSYVYILLFFTSFMRGGARRCTCWDMIRRGQGRTRVLAVRAASGGRGVKGGPCRLCNPAPDLVDDPGALLIGFAIMDGFDLGIGRSFASSGDG